MKKALLSIVIILLSGVSATAVTIPNKIIGQYQAEVPAFEFEDKGRTVKASAFTLELFLKKEFIIYKSGILEFQGEYTNVIENGDMIDVNVSISNQASIDFDFDITVNKKTGALNVTGLKGVPQVILEKRQIEVKKNNRGFKRL